MEKYRVGPSDSLHRQTIHSETWWRHQMETFSALLAGNSLVTGEFPSQSPNTNGWINNRDAGDLRSHCDHYDVIVMWQEAYFPLFRCSTCLHLLHMLARDIKPLWLWSISLCSSAIMFGKILGIIPWWRHQMETYSALLAICAGNSPVNGEFRAQRPVTRSFGVFFYLRLIKRLNKQSWGWWFETPYRPLWRHCNGKIKATTQIKFEVSARLVLVLISASRKKDPVSRQYLLRKVLICLIWYDKDYKIFMSFRMTRVLPLRRRRRAITFFFNHMLSHTDDLVTRPCEIATFIVSYTLVYEISAGGLEIDLSRTPGRARQAPGVWDRFIPA